MNAEEEALARGQFSRPFLFGYWLLTRARRVASVLKRRALSHVMPEPKLGEGDYAAFKKIEALIPDLESYRDSAPKRLFDLARTKGFDGLSDYYVYLLDHEGELAHLKENLTFVGTHFFRGEVWPELRRCIRTELADRDRLKVWCAGCSVGKEVYSLLMTLLDYKTAEKIDLLASDYNDEVLEKCREGIYPLITVYEIPERFRVYTERYDYDAIHVIKNSVLNRTFRIVEQLRNMVHTEHANLLDDDYPTGFDLVFCRNVIKFFDDETIVDVQRKLAATLNAGGFLVVSEDVHELIADPASMGLERVGESCIYKKRAG